MWSGYFMLHCVFTSHNGHCWKGWFQYFAINQVLSQNANWCYETSAENLVILISVRQHWKLMNHNCLGIILGLGPELLLSLNNGCQSLGCVNKCYFYFHFWIACLFVIFIICHWAKYYPFVWWLSRDMYLWNGLFFSIFAPRCGIAMYTYVLTDQLHACHIVAWGHSDVC